MRHPEIWLSCRVCPEVGRQVQVAIGEHRTRIAIPVTYLGQVR